MRTEPARRTYSPAAAAPPPPSAPRKAPALTALKTANGEQKIGRTEAARLLGVSQATIRRLETEIGVELVDGVHVFDPADVRRYAQRRRSQVDGEIAALAFEAFDRKTHPVDVVKLLRAAPDLVEHLHAQWSRLRGLVSLTPANLDELASIPGVTGAFPVTTGDELVEIVRRSIALASGDA